MNISVYEKDEVAIFKLAGCAVTPSNEKILVTVEKTLPKLSSPPKLVFDFREVDRIDCAGLGILMKLSAKIRPQGGRIALINLKQQIKYIIIITRLYKCLECYNCERDALDAMKPRRQ